VLYAMNMEKFPSPEGKEIKISKLAKAALVGAALTAATHAEAQSHHRTVEVDNSITMPTVENAESDKENQRIFNNLEKIENWAKTLSPKISSDQSLTYSVITESTALGKADYVPNKLEKVLAQDALIVIANKEDRTYRLMDREFGSISALIKEQETIKKYGDPKDANHVFEYYTPVDVYITVGAKQENDSTLSATIKVFNLLTHTTDTYSITHILKRDMVPEDGYHALEKAVQEKVREIVDQFGEK
jgi:hypothetical protein